MQNDLKNAVYLASFLICCLGVAIGMVLGLLGLWVPNFGEIGWKLFLSDVVVTIAALMIGGLTSEFWRERKK